MGWQRVEVEGDALGVIKSLQSVEEVHIAEGSLEKQV